MASPTPEELATLKSLAVAPSADEADTLRQLSRGVPALTPTPGMLESTGRGLEQGATLGFGDEINGGLSALLDSLTGKNKDLSVLQDYQKQRDQSRKAMDAASAAHPYISGASNLVGAVVPALLTGGGSLAEEGLAGAAKLGAGYGAIGGLGNSTADLTKGDVAGNLKDAAIGAATGGALAPVATAATQTIAPSLKMASNGLKDLLDTISGFKAVKTPLDALDLGLKGIDIRGARGARNAEELALNAASPNRTQAPGNVLGALQDTANSYGSQQLGLLQGAAPLAPNDYMPWVQQAQMAVTNAQEGAGGATGSGLPVINKLIQDTFYNAVDNGAGGTSLTPKPQVSMMQLQNFKQALGKLGSAEFANGMADPTSEALVNRLVSPLQGRNLNFQERLLNLPEGITPLTTFMEAKVPGLEDVNQNLSTVVGALKNAPSVGNLVTSGKPSLEGSDALSNMLNTLKQNPATADLADQVQSTLGTATKARTLSRTAGESGLSQGIVGDTVRGVASTGGNWAGLALRGLYNASPDAIKSVAAAVADKAGEYGETASRLASVLTQAADRDNTGRNALFFAIEQNPQYRDVLRKLNDEHTP